MAQRAAGLVRTVAVTPTITAGAYSANDQVGGVQTLDLNVNPEVAAASSSKGKLADDAYTLMTLTIVDKAAQDAAMVVSFFNASPTAAGDNSAYSLSDADAAAYHLGDVVVSADDYVSHNACSIATLKVADCALALKTLTRTGNTTGSTGDSRIYAVIKTTGTPTYGSTSDLVFKYTFAVDV